MINIRHWAFLLISLTTMMSFSANAQTTCDDVNGHWQLQEFGLTFDTGIKGQRKKQVHFQYRASGLYRKKFVI